MTSGEGICNFSLATSEQWRNQAGNRIERTEWHNITMYRRLAEVAAQYLRKGAQVYIEGRIQSRKYQGKDGIERTAYDIVANEMKMLGGRQDNPQGEVPVPPTAKPITSEQYRTASGGSTRRQPAPVTSASDIDGDIPY